MKIKELRTMSETELTRHLAEKQEELRALRFSARGEGLTHVRTIRAARREVAQMHTLLGEKQ